MAISATRPLASGEGSPLVPSSSLSQPAVAWTNALTGALAAAALRAPLDQTSASIVAINMLGATRLQVGVRIGGSTLTLTTPPRVRIFGVYGGLRKTPDGVVAGWNASARARRIDGADDPDGAGIDLGFGGASSEAGLVKSADGTFDTPWSVSYDLLGASYALVLLESNAAITGTAATASIQALPLN